MAKEETIRKLRKYLGSQTLYNAVRLTVAALLPAIILYRYHLLASAIALPLGAMFTGLTDSPGPLHHRRNALAISIFLNFIIILLAGALHTCIPLVIIALITISLFLSLVAVYGTRAGSIGLNALIVFIFNIDGHLSASGNALHEALFFAAGGLWYALLSLLLYTLRPFRLMQQMLGECLIEIAGYLQTKGGFYAGNPNYDELNNRLIHFQTTIRQMQEDLRELLFKTRNIIEESSGKGRILMSVFLDSIDLMERIMTSQYDYKELHARFAGTRMLDTIMNQIDALSVELHETGLALQSNFATDNRRDLDALQQETMEMFFELRRTKLNDSNIEDFIALRQILNSLQDITERIKRLKLSTHYDAKTGNDFKTDIDLEKFITHSDIDPAILWNNITLQSSNFRHAIRLTAGLLLGYIISLFFPLGHSYWILLTIAVIIKPAYSITRQRNIQRVGGTIAGAIIGFGFLYLVSNTTAIFIFMIVTMVIAYSFLKSNYFIGSAGVTLYVLLSFSFLNAAGLRTALGDRVTDTIIGSAIAWIVAVFVLPKWEHEQIDNDVSKAISANCAYFNAVALYFSETPVDITTFKLHRKDAFVALANLSDTFQRMLSEPKSRQVKMADYHQLVATSHTLTSYIATLSYYAQRNAGKYMSPEFTPVISQINEQFEIAAEVLQHHRTERTEQIKPLQPVSGKVQELLAKRRLEISTGASEMETPVRKMLSDIKTIHDQFQLIHTAAVDEVKILQTITE